MEDVRGIWLSSDDYEAVENVKEIVQRYFPEVDAGRVVWISARAEKETPDARVTEQLATTSFSMVRGASYLVFPRKTTVYIVQEERAFDTDKLGAARC